MKTKHYVIVFALVVGLLYLYHVYATKGGVSGFKSGLGLS